ncbi:hypothetical protein [Clostridium perfringens]|uniref:hypothetical protein n=1 Tax=Clostridium perfringens TaxID=1502 RepID=UPI0039E88197
MIRNILDSMGGNNNDNNGGCKVGLIGLYTVLMLVIKVAGLANVSWWLVFAPQLIIALIFGLVVIWWILTKK